MRAIVGASSQEKALVEASSVIVKSLQRFVWSSNIYIMLDTYRYRLSPSGHWLADSVYFSNPKMLWLVMFPNIYSFCFIYPRLCFCLLTSSAVYWPEQWRYLLPDVVMSRSQLNQYDIYNIYNIHTSTQYPDDKLPAPALILLCPI